MRARRKGAPNIHSTGIMDIRLRKSMARYRKKSSATALFELLVTLFLFSLFYAAGIFLASTGRTIAMLPCACMTGCFLVRLFIIQHDCGHASFFVSKRANTIVGSVLGVVTLTPFHCWRRCHAIHHAHSGNLDERAFGGVHTLAVQEYEALTPWQRRLYRLYRNPFVLFGIGAFALFFVRQRLTYYLPREWKTERASVHATNICIAVLILAVVMAGGGRSFFLFHVPAMAFAASLGVWLFYVQHQFPDSYWSREEDWNRVDAVMIGSSHYELPGVARWMTANIGLHHIHHLDSAIPSYRLQACLVAHQELQRSQRFTFRESLSYTRLKLWDEEQRRMVPFPSTRPSATLASSVRMGPSCTQ
jgi:omega-6 fatty acid desaturase (delta-12 desaturase)